MELSQTVEQVQLLWASLSKLPEPVARPVFIVVSGLPGSGKTYFSRKLAEELPLLILESDALRKILSPKPSYRPEENAELFQTIHLLIMKLLKDGISLILDATNLSEHNRERLYSIAERSGVKLILVYIKASPEVISARLKARKESSDSKSDADWTVYQRMLPLVERMKRHHFVVDTTHDIAPALKRIAREAMR